MTQYRIDTINDKSGRQLYAVMRNGVFGWTRVAEFANLNVSLNFARSLADEDAEANQDRRYEFDILWFGIGVLLGVFAGLLVANERTADERAACDHRVAAYRLR